MRAVLTFHSIDNEASVLSYPPALLERLLKTLALKNIPILTLDELLLPDTDRGVALTFDDGMKSVLSTAMPILNSYDAAAHLFVTSNAVGNTGEWNRGNGHQYEMLTWDDIEILSQQGFRIDAHTRSHPDMRTLSEQQMIDECASADEIITSRTGSSPSYFAYPFGFHNTQARSVAGERYTATVTTELAVLANSSDYRCPAVPRLDSYYLRNERSIRLFDSWYQLGYYRARSILRTLRGTQSSSESNKCFTG